MNRDETANLMRLVSVSWGRRKPTETDIDDWWPELADTDFEQARSAVRTMRVQEMPGPSLADILRATAKRSGPQQQYRDEDGKRYGPTDQRHPEHREHGCECWQDDRGVWHLCAMHTQRANRWLAIISQQRTDRVAGITNADPEPTEERF
jgi:hypothetical protein